MIDALDRYAGFFVRMALALPIVLVPLVFTGFHTNTIVIKEPLLHFGLIYMALALPLLWRLRRREGQPASALAAAPAPFWIALAGLWIWLWISATRVAPHPRSDHALLNWTSCLATALLFAEYGADRKRFRFAIAVTLWVSAAAALYALLQACEIDFFDWHTFAWELGDVRRVCSSFGNPDYLAGYLVGLIPLALAAALASRPPWSLLSVFLFLSQCAALILTYSRGGWVTVFVTGLLFAGLFVYINWMSDPVLVPVTVRWPYWTAAAVLLAIGLGALVWTSWDAIWAAAYRFANLASGESVSTRPYYYRAAVSMWLAAPLAGHGIGMFAAVFPMHRPPELTYIQPFKEFYVEHAHNEFLQIAAETGLIGLVLYAAVLGAAGWMIFGRLFAERNRENLILLGIGLGIFGILFHNLFTVTLRYTPSAFLLWSLLGLGAGRALSGVRPPKRVERVSLWVFSAIWVCCVPYLGINTIRYYTGDSLIRASIDIVNGIEPDGPLIAVRQGVEDSLSALRRGERLAPDHVRAPYWQGVIYNKWAYDFEQAADAYQRLFERQPHFTATARNLAVNYLQQAELLGNPQLMPQLAPYFQHLSLEYAEKAERWIDTALDNDPNWPPYYFLKGRCLAARGAFGEAAAYFRKTIELADRFPARYVQEAVEESRRYLSRFEAVYPAGSVSGSEGASEEE